MNDIRDSLTTIFHKLLQYMPHLSIAAVLLVASGLLLLGEIYLLFKAAIILVPLLIISIILIWNKKIIWNTPLSIVENLSFNIPHRRLCLLYALIFTVTYIWAVWNQEFDGLFLFLIVFLYGITIVQIFSKHATSKAILIELILTTLLFSYVQVFGFALSYPSIDLLPHSQWIEAILFSSNTLPADIAGAYFFFRLYHIYIACGTLLSGLDVHAAAYLFHIPFAIISSLFVYYISKHLSKSLRVSELATFSFLMIPAVMHYMLCIMPSVFAAMSFLVILYLFLMDTNKMNPTIRLVLAGIFTLYMTLVHHMTLPLAFFFMAIIIISAVLYKHEFSKTERGMIILFYTIPILYFLYTYLSSTISTLMIRLFSPVEAGMQSTFISITETWNISFWINSSVSAIMIVLLYSMIYYFSQKSNGKKYPYLIILPMTVLLLIFFIPGIVDISTQVVNMFLILRWRLVLAPIFAIGLGIGICSLLNLIYTKTKKTTCSLILIVFLCILFILSSAVILQSDTNSAFDNSFLDSTDRQYFDSDDLKMYGFVASSIPSGSSILTDYSTSKYYSTNAGMELYNQPYYSYPLGLIDLFSEVIPNINCQYIIFRQNIYEANHLFVQTAQGTGNTRAVKFNDSESRVFAHNIYSESVCYNNGNSQIYYIL